MARKSNVCIYICDEGQLKRLALGLNQWRQIILKVLGGGWGAKVHLRDFRASEASAINVWFVLQHSLIPKTYGLVK